MFLLSPYFLQVLISCPRLGLIITSEKASEAYSTHFITSLFKEEGKKIFDVRESILGHLQQGGAPSALDRYDANTIRLHIFLTIAKLKLKLTVYSRTSAAALMGFCMELLEKVSTIYIHTWPLLL